MESTTITLFVVSALLTLINILIGVLLRTLFKRLEVIEETAHNAATHVEKVRYEGLHARAEMAGNINSAMVAGFGKVHDRLNKVQTDLHNELQALNKSVSALCAHRHGKRDHE